ncbi:hypothetical protein ACJX0J_038109, partial [Zea mays]
PAVANIHIDIFGYQSENSLHSQDEGEDSDIPCFEISVDAGIEPLTFNKDFVDDYHNQEELGINSPMEYYRGKQLPPDLRDSINIDIHMYNLSVLPSELRPILSIV